jgi:predicted DNA-binding WGR domain protein
MSAVELRKIDEARNMRRFYRLSIESDLFGGALLMKQWGRIGARGRVVAERYDSEAPIAVSHWLRSPTEPELISVLKIVRYVAARTRIQTRSTL